LINATTVTAATGDKVSEKNIKKIIQKKMKPKCGMQHSQGRSLGCHEPKHTVRAWSGRTKR